MVKNEWTIHEYSTCINFLSSSLVNVLSTFFFLLFRLVDDQWTFFEYTDNVRRTEDALRALRAPDATAVFMQESSSCVFYRCQDVFCSELTVRTLFGGERSCDAQVIGGAIVVVGINSEKQLEFAHCSNLNWCDRTVLSVTKSFHSYSSTVMI